MHRIKLIHLRHILARLLVFMLLAGMLPACTPGRLPGSMTGALLGQEQPVIPNNLSPAPSRSPSEVKPVASYDIQVRLDVETKMLYGKETIRYVNTTSKTMRDAVFHLYLNAFRDSKSSFLQETGGSHRGFTWDAEHPGWITVTHLALADGTPLTLKEIEDGTLARARLPEPVLSGQTLELVVEFNALLPRVFARTGFEGDFFMVGQWFPKLGVWEDGAWSAEPFYSNAEFYANFGDYQVAITLPDGYVTGATGVPLEQVVDGEGNQTITYRAEGVIDFAWAASPHFQRAWRTVEGVELLYLYLPEHAWTEPVVMDAAEAAVRGFGAWFGAYPYPRLTVIDVPDEAGGAGGMEYPTLVTAGAASMMGGSANLTGRLGIDNTLVEVVVHEIGHQWWQSMVAFNETQEPWLDEGLTTYSSIRLIQEMYGEDFPMLSLGGWQATSLEIQRMGYRTVPEVRMYGSASVYDTSDYQTAAYSKPLLALMTLENVLGEEVMLEILSTFFQRYQYAHPKTEHFQATAAQAAGDSLDWFFVNLVYGADTVNYRISSLDEHSVTVEREGRAPIPVEMLVTFTDRSQVLEAWDGAQTPVTFTYEGKRVARAEIDPERKILMDMQWSDNGRSRTLLVGPWLALSTRLLYQIQNLMLIMGGL